MGSNLPPLKSDIIMEKKRELEEYQEFKRLKARYREEKRLQKIQEKMIKKKFYQSKPLGPPLLSDSMEVSKAENSHQKRVEALQPSSQPVQATAAEHLNKASQYEPMDIASNSPTEPK